MGCYERREAFVREVVPDYGPGWAFKIVIANALTTEGKRTLESLRETLFETAAGADEELMEKYFEDMMLSEEDTVKGLRQGLKDRTVFPVLCGAADSGIGTEAVLQAIVDYVPDPAAVGEVATADGGKLAIDPNEVDASVVVEES